jgi:hypothetical protein
MPKHGKVKHGISKKTEKPKDIHFIFHFILFARLKNTQNTSINIDIAHKK